MQPIYRLCYVVMMVLAYACHSPEDPTTPPEILSFDFGGVKVVSVQIDAQLKKVIVELPYQTSLVSLTPQIKTTEGTSIIPQSGVSQNFTQKVYYTLTSKDGVKVIYTVEVKTATQPNPEILSVEKDTVEAGFDFTIQGKNFGKFSLDIKVFLQDAQQKETQLTHQLVDTSTIRIKTPIDLSVGSYQVKLQVKDKSTLSTKRVYISYPAPQLKSLEKNNLLNTDTLWLSGQYLDINRYQFSLELQSGTTQKSINRVGVKSGKVGFLLNNTIFPQVYEVKLYNQTERKYNREKGFQLQVYAFDKPFVKEFQTLKESYQKGESIVLKTLNFTEASARFYQVSLQSGNRNYTQNGIYDSGKKLLTFSLPTTIEKGMYQVSLTLTEPSRSYSYGFDTDLQIAVKE